VPNRVPKRSRGTKKGRRAALPTISARIADQVAIEPTADGKILVRVNDQSMSLGSFGASAAELAQKLRTGLPLASFASRGHETDKAIDQLVRRLAHHGLLEYVLPRPRGARVGKDKARKDQAGTDQVVIEPQLADYWPQPQPLNDADILALSRFAYMRRRGDEMVLESPRAGALFRICDPRLAEMLAVLAMPQQIKRLRQLDSFCGLELIALLLDCDILFKIKRGGESGLRTSEGDDDLVLWDFHDLVFHTRSTEGRHANPLGGTYAYAGIAPALPAVRPDWPGEKIDLSKFLGSDAQAPTPIATLLRERESTRDFDEEQPIALSELSRFLASTARVLLKLKSGSSFGDDGGPEVEYALRPYPSAGSCYELELYVAVDKCEGLPQGFYHYGAEAHTLVPLDVEERERATLLEQAAFAMGASSLPQVLITIAARFGRVSWKYSSIAYGLILKDVGVLTQTFYLMATDMGLGGCAIGSINIDLFEKMTGIGFHVEGPVGQFALGRVVKSDGTG
jgi:SagB-type dehydrogenase family enzyme